MLGRVTNLQKGHLCAEEEGHSSDDEIKLLSHTFISSGYDPNNVDSVIDLYVFDKSDNDKEAEHGTYSMYSICERCLRLFKKTTCQGRSECQF